MTRTASTFLYSLDIHGWDARITLRGLNFLEFEFEVSSKAIAAFAQPTIIRPRIVQDNITMLFVPELEEFAAAVKEGRSPLITVGEGWEVLKVLDAIV